MATQKFFTILLISFISISILFNNVVNSIAATNNDNDGQKSNTASSSTSSNSNNSPPPKLKQASSSKVQLIIINEDDWEQMLHGEWMVEFHAPWCPACRALQPEWKTFSSWSSDLGIKVGAVDVTANPGLSGRFMVTALPTIYHVKEGQFRQYKGTRDTNSFVSFIEEKKWQSIEPISSWKAPNSIPMSLVSTFFKISMSLRGIHNSLVEDYGIPYWGSYMLFAFTTILFGALLGLFIVCIVDLMFPAKTPEETLKRPAAQADIIDDTEDNQNRKRNKNNPPTTTASNDDETEEDEDYDGAGSMTDEEDIEDDDEGDEDYEDEEYQEEDEEPAIEEVLDDNNDNNVKPKNIRQRKPRRD